ncbi:MAG TPA: DUF2087 domain-containing protein [Desertimonas sp.]|nr:DUF2087 domain-containing protein [Desertimonas sp.]
MAKMRETPLATDVGSTGPDAKVIAGALADADRRRMFAAIELGAATLLDAAKASGLPDHRAAKALARLVDSGVIIGDRDGGLRVDGAALAKAARVALTRPPSDEHAAEPPERRKVLEAFVREGRITSMPTAPAKREVVLDWLARRFEIGRRYPEAEVNSALDGHAEDHVSLRRSLVDAELLCRDDGMYWRCGGTI